MKKLIITIGLLAAFNFATAQKSNCHGITTKGIQCKIMVLDPDTLCHQHDPATPRCNAERSNGLKCRMIVKESGQHCHHHNGSAKHPKGDTTAIFYELKK